MIARSQRLVVIGNGMAGARLVEDVLARGGARSLRRSPSSATSRTATTTASCCPACWPAATRSEDIFINPLAWYAANGVTLHAGVRVEAIDVASAKQVRGADGVVEPYDTLVIATGSRPLVPPIDGRARRTTASDSRRASSSFARSTTATRSWRTRRSAKRAAVIGGGLLGLEAARGLLERGPRGPRRPPDAAPDGDAARRRRRRASCGGSSSRWDARPSRNDDDGGAGRRAGDRPRFRGRTTLECDMVVDRRRHPSQRGPGASGRLARRARHRRGRRPRVSRRAGRFAIGECAQHRGQVYGLVAPLWEQAQRAGRSSLRPKPDARYHGLEASPPS